MSERALELRGVSAGYGREPVVRDVSLDLRPGEVVGLLGPNGSGKTTLVRVCAGLLPAGAGQVLLDGRPISLMSGPERARLVAVVPQRPELGFPFTVAEVVLMGRAPHSRGRFFETARDLDAARRAMDAAAVSHLSGRPFREISGGEQQRVFIAAALAQEPLVLLLDEPTSSLDLRHQVDMLSAVRSRCAGQGTAALAALHDVNLAARFCDRVALLSQGRLAALGPPEQVITYANVRAIYETEVYVGLNEIDGKVFMVPMGHFPLDRGRPSG